MGTHSNRSVGTDSHEPSHLQLRVFVSSPGDVATERFLCEKVLVRLQDRYRTVCHLEPIFWEHEPLVATETFQTQLPSPAETDIVICILWSRIGTRLPHGVAGGGQTGTEFEFREALRGLKERGLPDLLVYRKEGPPLVALDQEEQVLNALQQKKDLDDFIRGWFHGPEGTLLAAFHTFKDGATFEEHLEQHLQKLIERRLKQASIDFAEHLLRSATWKNGSPFRGLDIFDVEHDSIFFGRTRAVSEIIDRLNRQAVGGRAFVVILGPSGSGKSSLVRAGVLPLLSRPGVIANVGLCRRSIFRPADSSGDLFDGLAAALLNPAALPELAADGTTSIQLAAMLRESPRSVPLLVKGALSQASAALKPPTESSPQPEARLLFFVDQFEELFSLETITDEQRSRFAAAISAMATSGRIWVVVTLRSDFYSSFTGIPELAALKAGNGQYDVQPPTPAEIGQMIRLPASVAGLRFEERQEGGERLDEVLRDATVANPDSLPLLEFTLDQLYEKRTGNLLTFATYDGLGRLEGAIATEAERVYLALDSAVQSALPMVFRRLVSISSDSHDAPTRKPASQSALLDKSRPAQRQFTQAFIDARLFLADQTNDGAPVVRITHESLLNRWERLQIWLAEDRELLRIRSRVLEAATNWERERHRQDLLLPAGKPLDEASELLSAEMPIDDNARRFIDLSLRRARRNRNLTHLAISTLVLLTVISLIASGVARIAQQDAETQKGLAHNAAAKSRDEAARADEEARRAEREAHRAEQQRDQAEQARKQADEATVIATQQRDRVEDMLHGASIFDFATGQRLLSEHRYSDAVAYFERSIRNNPKNENASTALWLTLQHGRTYFPRLPSHIIGGEQGAASDEFTVNDAIFETHQMFLIVSGSKGVLDKRRGIAQIWDLALDRPRGIQFEMAAPIEAMAVSHDGKLIATSTEDATQVWNMKSGQPVGPSLERVKTREFCPKSILFSPDGSRLLSFIDRRSLRLYETATGRPVGSLLGHEGSITSRSFSSDGSRIITSSLDHTVRVWDASTGQQTGETLTHEEAVFDAAFSPDGNQIAAAVNNFTVQVWDAKNQRAIGSPLKHDDSPVCVEYSPDGTRLVSCGCDRRARIWDADTLLPVGDQMVHRDKVDFARFSPDGTRLLTSSNEQVCIWDSRTCRLVGQPIVHDDTVSNACWGEDGSSLVTVSGGRAYVWTAASQIPFAMPIDIYPSFYSQVSVNRDGSRVVYADILNHAANIVDVATGEVCAPLLFHDAAVKSAAFSPDGKSIVTASDDGSARVWEAGTGQSRGVRLKHPGKVCFAVYAPDGERIITGCEDDKLRVWDARSGGRLENPLIVRLGVRYGSVCPEGNMVIVGGGMEVVKYDVMRHHLAGSKLKSYDLPMAASLSGADVSPCGRRIVIHSTDRIARIWEEEDIFGDVEVGRMEERPRRGALMLTHPEEITSAMFSANGRRIVTACDDGAARIWDTETGQQVGPPLQHSDKCSSACFMPKGDRIITASGYDSRIWKIEVPPLPPAPVLNEIVSVFRGYELDERLGTDVALSIASRLDRARELCDVLQSFPEWKFLLISLMQSDSEAPVMPDSVVTRRNATSRWVWYGRLVPGGIVNLELVIGYDPSHPLLAIALAGYDEYAKQAGFLREYGVKRLPKDVDVCLRAVAMSIDQDALEVAEQALDKAAELGAQHSQISSFRRAIEEMKVPADAQQPENGDGSAGR